MIKVSSPGSWGVSVVGGSFLDEGELLQEITKGTKIAIRKISEVNFFIEYVSFLKINLIQVNSNIYTVKSQENTPKNSQK